MGSSVFAKTIINIQLNQIFACSTPKTWYIFSYTFIAFFSLCIFNWFMHFWLQKVVVWVENDKLAETCDTITPGQSQSDTRTINLQTTSLLGLIHLTMHCNPICCTCKCLMVDSWECVHVFWYWRQHSLSSWSFLMYNFHASSRDITWHKSFPHKRQMHFIVLPSQGSSQDMTLTVFQPTLFYSPINWKVENYHQRIIILPAFFLMIF